MTKVTIVILHYLGKKFTVACLDSLGRLKLNKLALEVFVVNNNPKESMEDLKKKFPEFIFLETGKNLGYAGGNNFGIKKALGNNPDYVLLLNNDTTVEKDFLVESVRVANGEKVGIVGPKIYFAPGYEYHKNRYRPEERGKVFWYAGGEFDWGNILCSHRGVDEVDKGQYEKNEETNFVTGCAMLIKRQVFKKIGLLDERYFLYLEDVEFCQRAKEAGFKIIYSPKAKVWHFNAGSSRVGSFLHDYFITRNRLLFGMKYASWRAKFNLIKESIKLLISGRPWQKIAVRDYYLGRFGKGSWHEKK